MKRDLLRLKVKQVARTKRVPLVDENTPISEALPFPYGRHHAWVTRKGKVVGVVTEHDILHFFAPRKVSVVVGIRNLGWALTHESPIGKIMSHPVITASEDDTVEDVLATMRAYNIRRVAVVDKEGKIKGEVCISDIIKAYIGLVKLSRKR